MNPAVLARYKRIIAAHRDRTAAGLIIAWNAIETYNDDGIAEFTERTSPLLAAAKVAAVASSASFFALALGIPPIGVRVDEVDTVPNVRAPFLAAWHAISMGRPWEEAVVTGRSVAEAVGFDFVQSTARRTGDHVARASGQRVRWRRAPGATSCDWCKTIAGQLYASAESADFGHERCDCDAVPVAA